MHDGLQGRALDRYCSQSLPKRDQNIGSFQDIVQGNRRDIHFATRLHQSTLLGSAMVELLLDSVKGLSLDGALDSRWEQALGWLLAHRWESALALQWEFALVLQ